MAISCIRKARWVVAWDGHLGQHYFRNDVDVAFDGVPKPDGGILLLAEQRVGGSWGVVSERTRNDRGHEADHREQRDIADSFRQWSSQAERPGGRAPLILTIFVSHGPSLDSCGDQRGSHSARIVRAALWLLGRDAAQLPRRWSRGPARLSTQPGTSLKPLRVAPTRPYEGEANPTIHAI